MISLFEAVNAQAKTDNGAKAHFSSLSKCLDLFYLAGASRGKDIKQEFRAALVENPELALRILQWLRDIRGGAGERQLFRDLLLVALDVMSVPRIDGNGRTVSDRVVTVVSKISEIGRFDDLLWLVENGKELEASGLYFFQKALKEGNGLAFKWTPIKGETAKKLRKAMGFKQEKEWRKYVVAGRKTVEQSMCAKEWDKIEFDKIPSVASARYQKAFGRNATERYGKYLESLQKGETKINASAVYPYDIFKSVYKGNADIAEQQWNALPNYMEGSEERVLPLIDTSSSMNSNATGGLVGMSCMDVAISLGWYIASRSTGTFKDVFMTFESKPRLLKVDTGSLKQRFDLIQRAPWGGSTNIQAAFKLILDAAVDVKLDPSQMPTVLVILSDMQFDCSQVEGRSATAFDAARALYQTAGYKMPKLVFWNLNASNKTAPVTKSDTGTVMVSGYSPAIMKSVLGKGTTPEEVMLETVMIERYAL